jgi:peptide/nickel transport system substrate-binding protein
VVSIAVLLAAGVAAGRAGSATPELRDGGTLVIGLAEEPDALDPTTSGLLSGRIVFAQMCEKLYDLNAKLQIVPQLAAELPQISADKLTYTIQIRPGIMFNDGTPLDAQAVKISLDRHRTLPGSLRASELSPVGSVTVTGPLTVQLKLTQRFSGLTAQLADRAGMILSPTQLAALGNNFASNPVCVGPFAFKERVAGDHITLVKSGYYYDRSKVHLDAIVFRFLTDSNARAQALRAGDIQVADRLAATDVPTIQSDSRLTVLQATQLGYQGLVINIGNRSGVQNGYENVGTPLARSQFLRTAFDLALDRTVINRVVFDSANVPDCYPISPASSWYEPTITGLHCELKADPELAKKLVAASGIPTPIKVTLLTGTSQVATQLGQVIQAMEQAVGFDVQLQQGDTATLQSRALTGQFDVLQIGWSGRVDPDGNIFGFVDSQGSTNFSGYSNPQLDFVLDNARKATSEQARTTLYAAALRIIHRQRPVIYLYHPLQRDGVSKTVGGVEMFADGLVRAGFAGFVR